MLTLRKLTGAGFGPIDAHVAQGECLAVMGASGSGKTRLLRGIADLDPGSGSCSLKDIPRNQIPATDWRRRVAYVPAEPGWWAPTAADHFVDVASCGGLVDRLGIDTAALNRPIEQLSTGERQRLALVRALQFAPEVLLLDEPTGPLDAQATGWVEDEIRDQMNKGVGVVLVTHEGAQSERLGAHVLTIASGRLSVDVREGVT